ncbi:MAG: hypothetical protein RSD61_03265 [Ruthenibacterium sp.]
MCASVKKCTNSQAKHHDFHHARFVGKQGDEIIANGLRKLLLRNAISIDARMISVGQTMGAEPADGRVAISARKAGFVKCA